MTRHRPGRRLEVRRDQKPRPFTFRRVAYLVAHFEIVDNAPRLVDCGIYSEPASDLTRRIGDPVWSADVLSATGEDLEEAIRNLVATAHADRSASWALAHLRDSANDAIKRALACLPSSN